MDRGSRSRGRLLRLSRRAALILSARRAEYLTGEPFCNDLSSTAGVTGLPVRLLQNRCHDGEIQACKLSGRRLLHRNEFFRLLDPLQVFFRDHGLRIDFGVV